ncbi:MAG: amidase [Acidobacteria bacterium]|nr:amidase [Acidobacteriota bacterium]
MRRRKFLQTSALSSAILLTQPLTSIAKDHPPASPAAPNLKSFELEELTIKELQDGMKAGKYTARSITEKYLARIEELDKRTVNAVIEINPEALAIAEALDQERKAGKLRGALHGIAVLIKDNIDTADKMKTSAGSLALADSTPPQDSFVAQRLRAAGAVIIGKTNLSEWANIRSSHSTSGWSGRGGLTRNPYALDRNPCGSSSGTGAALSANFAAIGIGTETDGSVVCPSNANSLVGIKPTVGLVSRAGIIPISHSQDTAGPMCRSVADAAILLGALTGQDPSDQATKASRGKALSDYTKFLDPQGLKGARIGVARKFFGINDAVDKLMNDALDAMKGQGAILVDPAEVPNTGKYDDSELTVLLYELKADLNAYLASLGKRAEVKSLKEIIEFNDRNRAREMPYFGQELFLKAQEKGDLTSKEYVQALAKNHRLSRTEGLDAVMMKHRLDAIVAPTGGTPWVTDLVNGDHFSGGYSTPSAVAGYPHITVPAGYLFGLPVGLSIFGRAWSEATLIKIAYAYEQATRHRQPPQFLATANVKM